MSLSTRKVIISILLGLAGFLGSHYSLNFFNSPFSLSIEWCDAMPLLAGMAFGPQYALIAATLGLGAFYPFALYANNGWGNVVTSILLVMTYSAVGYFTLVRYRKPGVWNHPFLIYPIIALLYNLLFRLLFPIALSFNPPFWYPNAALSMPVPVLDGIVVKSFVILNVLIIINDLLLKLPFVRDFLGLENKKESRFNERIALGILLVFTALWFVFVLFNRIFIDQTFPQGLFQPIHPPETIAAILFLAANVVVTFVVIQFMESRLRALDELEKSKESYRLIFEQAADGIFIMDENGHYVDVNESGCKLTGYTRDEILQLNIYDLVMPEEQANVTARVKSLNDGDTPVFERIVRHKNGSPIDVEVSGAKLADGRLQGMVHDISGRKRAEAALRESAARFQSLLDDSPISLWEEDYSGVKKCLDELRAQGVEDFSAYLIQHPEVVSRCLSLVKVLNVNHATLVLFGAASKADMWIKLSAILPEEGYGSFRNELVLIASGATHFEMETINQTLDGRRINVNFNWAVMPGHENDLSLIMVSLIDITDRKQAEEKLRQSEAGLSALVENTGGSIWSVDEHYRLLNSNKKFQGNIQAILGRDLQVGENVLSISLDKDFIAAWRERYDRALGGEAFSYETRTDLLPKSPAMEYHITPIRSEGGAVTGVTAFVLDISERKQAEAQVATLLERLNLALDAGRMGVWDWDIIHDRLVWDERMYELYGVKKEDFAGAYEAWLNGLHPDDRARNDEISLQAQRGEMEYDTEFRVVWPDGTVRWLKANGQIIRAADGSPLRMIGVNYDITASKIAEEQLRYQANILKNVSDAVILTDAGFKIEAWNPGAERLYGWREDQVLGRSFDEVTSTEYPNTSLSEVLAEFQKNGNWQGESIQYRQDGTVLNVFSSVTALLDDSGKLGGVVAINRDITERKQAEERLKAASAELQRLLTEADRSRAVLLNVIEAQKIAEKQVNEQLEELRRWYSAMLGREKRTIELKKEVNDLLAQAGLPPRYADPLHGSG